MLPNQYCCRGGEDKVNVAVSVVRRSGCKSQRRVAVKVGRKFETVGMQLLWGPGKERKLGFGGGLGCMIGSGQGLKMGVSCSDLVG